MRKVNIKFAFRIGLPLIAKLVKMRHTSILITVIGTLQECASEKAYCVAIMEADGMIADLVRNLQTERWVSIFTHFFVNPT